MTKTEIYINYILEKLRSGIVEPKDIVAEFCNKFHKSDRTFWYQWKIASQMYQEALKQENEVKEGIYIENNVQEFKSGLKSKTERLLILQNEIINSINELEYGKATYLYKSGDEFETAERDLTIFEKAKLRQVIKELQSEISKIEGDYAPLKTEDVTKKQLTKAEIEQRLKDIGILKNG